MFARAVLCSLFIGSAAFGTQHVDNKACQKAYAKIAEMKSAFIPADTNSCQKYADCRLWQEDRHDRWVGINRNAFNAYKALNANKEYQELKAAVNLYCPKFAHPQVIWPKPSGVECKQNVCVTK